MGRKQKLSVANAICLAFFSENRLFWLLPLRAHKDCSISKRKRAFSSSLKGLFCLDHSSVTVQNSYLY